MGRALRAALHMTNEIYLANQRCAPDVSLQPEAVLKDWRIFECHRDGQVQRNISGWPEGSKSLRLSSPVVEINVATRIVITSSGRGYHLQSPPTTDGHLLQIIAVNAYLNGLGADFIDVSDSLWAEMLKAAH